MTKTAASLDGKLISRMKSHMRRFHEDESGGMIIFTLFVLVMMLIVGGMAVDFMRFESRRSLMQGVVDRAVLAAADLDQNLDAADVVRDYILKSEGGGCIKGEPIIVPGANFRSVTANCEMTMDTHFLRLIGLNELTASASATAIEGVGNVEVSLVLDISGSMGETISGTSDRRIDRLEEASLAFVDTLLDEDFEDKISLSLIPYSAHVNAGPDLFAAVNADRMHNFSNCVEIPADQLRLAEWDNTVQYGQGQNFQLSAGAGALSYPNCPRYEYEQIIPISQNKAEFVSAIEALEPRATTSIFIGLKWAATLLDPGFRSTLAFMPAAPLPGSIDPAFSSRPAAYGDTSGPGGVKKYIVVMTDGENFETSKVQDWAYDTPSERAHWAYEGFTNFYWSDVNGAYGRWDEYAETQYTADQGNDFMESICTSAKEKGIVIFAIAMAAPPVGEEEMSKCASSPSHYFETSGAELVQIFEAIADQITDLRLTL